MYDVYIHEAKSGNTDPTDISLLVVDDTPYFSLAERFFCTKLHRLLMWWRNKFNFISFQGTLGGLLPWCCLDLSIL